MHESQKRRESLEVDKDFDESDVGSRRNLFSDCVDEGNEGDHHGCHTGNSVSQI